MFLQARNFIKKRLQHRYFLVNIVKFLRTAFLIEQLWWLLLKVFAQNLIASVWAVTFSTYRSVCLELFLAVTSETILKKKSNCTGFANMNVVFLLTASANSLMDNFPLKYMSYLWSLIWSNRVWESWYLIIWLEITVLSSAMGFWTVAFSSWH